MRTKMVSALALTVVLFGTLTGCKNLGGVDGNIINTRMDNGQYQVQVKEFVDQQPANAPWVDVPADKAQACQVGDPYPQCKDR
jgi:hypothetical protein